MTLRPDQRALILKNGKMEKFVKEGSCSKPFSGEMEIFFIQQKFEPKSISLELALEEDSLTDELHIVELSDHQIALHYENKNFKEVLKSGKHAFWKSIIKRDFIRVDLNNPWVDESIDRMVLMRPELKELVCSYAIESYQKGILFIEKAFSKVLEPGNYFFWQGSKSIQVNKVDLRQQQMEVTGQEIMSKDRVPLRVNFSCQYKIVDIMKTVMEINGMETQMYILLQLALREYIGGYTLDDILDKKEEIGAFVHDKLKDKLLELGVELINSGIKDVVLPGEIKDILNQVLIAEKKAQANVIMRREETASTRSLLNTAKLLEDNKVLYHLKELEYIERISEKITQLSINGGGTQLLSELKKLFVPEHKV